MRRAEAQAPTKTGCVSFWFAGKLAAAADDQFVGGSREVEIGCPKGWRLKVDGLPRRFISGEFDLLIYSIHRDFGSYTHFTTSRHGMSIVSRTATTNYSYLTTSHRLYNVLPLMKPEDMISQRYATLVQLAACQGEHAKAMKQTEKQVSLMTETVSSLVDAGRANS